MTANPTATGSSTGRRRRSRDLVLACVRDGSGVTRADLERLTGLSRSAVASAVAALLEQGLLAEHERSGNGNGSGGDRGRPALLLRATGPDGLVLGVDFGHAHVAVALADTAGSIRAERRRDLDVDAHAAQALDTAADLVRTVLAAAGCSIDDVGAVAAGIPGPLDRETNVVRSPTILASWVDVHPGAELEHRIGTPVHSGNDADMGARGELRFGAARGLRDFLYVKVSHGIGAGLVLNGEVYRGASGLTGEIGHTQIAELGGWCRCGNRGCLETVVSAPHIARRLREVAGSAGADLDDPIGLRVVTEAGRTLGRVIADLCNCLNPAAVIVGGELAALGEGLLVGIRESISRYAQPATAQALVVIPAALGDRAELLGAIALAGDVMARPR